ncbi:MAG: chromosome segregation SMC family protein, partial [Nitrososphaerota archaeon]
FALGELSAHNLRVGKLAELIHDDPSINYARISITLDNSDRAIPLDSDEVTISRRIDRNGESEYTVNGRQVSRNELLTLLSMANIRPSGFNIVPQGSVIEIAERGGVELRKMLEEVAGISDYEKKRAEAEEQLAIAEKNLAIAKASTKEVKARVKQLEKERNQALRRRLAENFLNSIQRHELERSISVLESELREVDERLLAAEERLRELEERRRARLEERERLREALEGISSRIEHADALASSLELLRRSRENRVNSLRIEISALEERCERLRREKDYLRESMRSLENRLAELSSERSRLLEEAEELKRLMDDASSREREKLEELRRAEETYAALKSIMERRLEEVRRRRLELEAEIAAAEAKHRALADEVKRLEAEIKKLRNERESILAELPDLEKKLETIVSGRRAVQEEVDKLERALEEQSSKISAIEEVERRLSAILERIASMGILKPEDNDFEKILDAIRCAGVRGVKGFLRAEISADEKILGVLETATEGWLDSLVVDSVATGLKIARALSGSGVRLRILPLDAALNARERPRIPGVKANSDWAEIALGYLLRDVRISDGPRHQAGKKILVDGVMIHPDLRIETISFSRELLSEVATREYREALRVLDKLRERREELRRELSELEKRMRALTSRSTSMSLEENRLTDRIQALMERASGAEKEILRRQERLAELRRELEELDRAVAEAKRKLEEIPEMKPDEEEMLSLKRLEEEMLEKRRSYEEARLRRSELQLRFSDAGRRLKELEAEEEHVKAEISRIAGKIEAAERERIEAAEKIRSLAAEEGILEIEIAEAMYGMLILSELRRSLDQDLKMLRLRAEETSAEISRLDEEIRAVSEARSSLRVRRAGLEVELGNLREKLSMIGEFTVEIPVIAGDELRELKAELEAELRELEVVNQLAPAQYEEIVGNYKIRSSRIAELEAERQEILRFIEWIESEKKRIFMETFNKVAESFENYFSRLTGGRGWLRLENPDNPFEGGIDMILAFPGKQPRSSRAASGGEKSVAAVALLLALQGLTPADFYIFDEVDAHMDLRYSQRLAELFKEMAKRTQIIVISLKDVMVEKADQVIGVYNAGGSSRVVKTRLEEVISDGR